MRRVIGGVVAAVAVAGLVACSGGGDEAAPASSSRATTLSPSPTSSAPASATAAASPQIACEGFLGDGGPDSLLQRVPAALNAAQAQITQAQLDELIALNNQIENLARTAPNMVAVYLYQIQGPFKEVATAREYGSSGVTMHTNQVTPAVTELVRVCNQHGYRVSQ